MPKKPKTISMRNQFICETVAAVIGEGCTPPVESLTNEEMQTVQEINNFGSEFIAPILSDFAEESDEDGPFGMRGKSGKKNHQRIKLNAR